jgi:arylformamidase
MHLIDLSQTIEPEMNLFSATAPKPQLTEWQSHETARQSGHYEDCSCAMTEVKFVTSLGTYMDSPYHFNSDGGSIETLTLAQTVLSGVVVDCTDFKEHDAIEPDVLENIDIRDKAVLFNTGWSRFWNQPKYMNFPYLTHATAEALRDGGAKLAGVDFLVIDDTTNPRRPVHVTLLHSNILIVENLTNLGDLPTDKPFTFHASPVKYKGAAAFPVRAYAVVHSD